MFIALFQARCSSSLSSFSGALQHSPNLSRVLSCHSALCSSSRSSSGPFQVQILPYHAVHGFPLFMGSRVIHFTYPQVRRGPPVSGLHLASASQDLPSPGTLLFSSHLLCLAPATTASCSALPVPAFRFWLQHPFFE